MIKDMKHRRAKTPINLIFRFASSKKASSDRCSALEAILDIIWSLSCTFFMKVSIAEEFFNGGGVGRDGIR